MTDGAANNNDSVDKITSEFGISCSGSTTGGETCGEELASFLNTEDQIPGLSGDQGIVTYTIGFDFSDSFLTDLALAGGGESFTASNGAELANVFQTIVTDFLNRSTSFSTPTLSINAFNKLEDLEDVYFALFTPNDKKAWRGNVKRYQLCRSSSDGCTLGEILDANDNPAINASDQRISDTALSFWSSGVDGAEIEVGGAAENVPNASSREVFTFHDLTEPLSNPIDEAIALSVNEVIDSNSDGILDGLNGHPGHSDALADTQFLLGDDAGVLSSAERKSLIDWIRGVDVDDEDGDGNTTENRFVVSDPLHSSPVAITFGGSNVDPVTKLFFGTNDGGLRMVNALNGIEEWIFYPQDMMRIQSELKTNNNGDHKYGLDGVPTAWVQDQNEDGIIVQSDGDFVRIIIGQRRGGQNYYAVDVTPSLAVTSPSETGNILPTLLWRIKGGSGDFPNLGQTWSRPSLATIRTGLVDANETELTDVIAFGGGYDVTQDNGAGHTNR